jgi:anti-anti-sigma factor
MLRAAIVIELNFQPKRALVSLVRRFVQDFFNDYLVDPAQTWRIGMTTHELLDNALRFSQNGASTTQVELYDDGRDLTAVITTTNPASPEHAAHLRQAVAAMRDERDPFAYYQRKLQLEREGGMGLARVFSEGGMLIDARVEGGRVTVEARTPVEQRAAAEGVERPRRLADELIDDAPGETLAVEIAFRADVKRIALIRKFVTGFYAHFLADPDVAPRVAMAAHELLENCLKCTTTGEAAIRIAFENGALVIRTVNPASAENAAKAEASLQALASAGDLPAHLASLLVRKSESATGAGVGFARIAVEAEMALSAQFDGGLLKISGRTPAMLNTSWKELAMSDSKIVPITLENFTTQVRPEGKRLILDVAGEADLAAVEAFAALLKQVHDEAQAQGVEEVVLDFTRLEFMNSSCFNKLANYVVAVSELPGAKQYRISIVSSPKQWWQGRSLRAIKALATDIMTIKEGT